MDESNWYRLMNKTRLAIGEESFEEFGLNDLEEENEVVNLMNKKTFPKTEIWHDTDRKYIKWVISGICIFDFKLNKSANRRPEEGDIINIIRTVNNVTLSIDFRVVNCAMQCDIVENGSRVCGRCDINVIKIQFKTF